MNYIKKKDGNFYKIVEQEVSVADLEFHITQLREQISKLEIEIKEMEKL